MKEASSATMTTSHSSPTGTVNSLALPQNLSGLFWLQATGNPPKVNVLAPIAGYRAQIMLSGRMSFFFFLSLPLISSSSRLTYFQTGFPLWFTR